MGETRLWYSLFLSAIGFMMYIKWQYNWVLSFSLLVALVFILINMLKPEIHSKNLMPALQSIWFVPHVTVYILSYSFLSAAAIAAIILLSQYRKQEPDSQLVAFTDNLVYVGFGLLMVGLLIGAVWAKEAWGHYWSWDPKETWAFVTVASYLIYIHIRLKEASPKKFTLWLIIFSFVLLMITWKGVSYLPAAQNSVHVYSD
jgi:ABC-type transport system involved in cytochrome c biogenesis permease subunit